MIRRGAVAVLAALVAACTAPPAPLAPVAGARPTLVSLNPCADAILAQVADPEQILAISAYSHDPRASSMDLAQARRFRAVGLSAEDVLALHPDVVVASTFTDPATRRAFAGLGLRVATIGSVTDLAAARAQVRELAALAGHPERGEALVRRMDAAVAAGSLPVGAAPVPALLWQEGGMVAGDGTLMADLMRRSGLPNAAAARGLGQADRLPLERLLADPPEVLITTADHSGEGNESRLLGHPALASLRQTARLRMDRKLTFCGGPTVIRAMDWLAQARRGLMRSGRTR